MWWFLKCYSKLVDLIHLTDFPVTSSRIVSFLYRPSSPPAQNRKRLWFHEMWISDNFFFLRTFDQHSHMTDTFSPCFLCSSVFLRVYSSSVSESSLLRECKAQRKGNPPPKKNPRELFNFGWCYSMGGGFLYQGWAMPPLRLGKSPRYHLMGRSPRYHLTW